MKLFQNAMEMFTPFAGATPKSNENEAPPPVTEDSIADLKAKLDAMQSQLDKLGKK